MNPKARVSIVPAILIGALALAHALDAAAKDKSTEYRTEVVATGLASPTGIVVLGNHTLVFSEVPTPGVPGSSGGTNAVKSLNVRTGRMATLSMGEPEPVNIAADRHWGLYWTCKSAGVILRKTFWGEPELFIDGLNQPNGISVDRNGDVLFTELPDPGNSGSNSVSVTDGTNVTAISSTEPAPTDIVIGHDGTAYWTCRSAGVILRRSPAGVISLLLSGLNYPTGIALDERSESLYFTETPTPGVPGSAGGQNAVIKVDLATLEQTAINEGDPEPTDVGVARNGNVYWTCTSAGVIVCAQPVGRGRN